VALCVFVGKKYGCSKGYRQSNAAHMPTLLYVSENWTSRALQGRRIEAAEMKLLRPLAGYTIHDHKTKDSVRREQQTECILDKIDE
jgi:hypothetical protein